MSVRIQRKRTKGWRMPEGAVYVGRPSLWGNPWSIRDVGQVYPEVPIAERPAAAVRLYRRELEHFGLSSDYGWIVSDAKWEAVWDDIHRCGAKSMAEYAPFALRGHDLVCWCPTHSDGCAGNCGTSYDNPRCPAADQPCHADVLLELAR